MYIQLNNTNEITGYADILTDTDGWIEISEPVNSQHFKSFYPYYEWIDKNTPPVYNREKHTAYQKREEERLLRACREHECFPVINRGRLWYDQLNEKQAAELSAWYQAWLGAPRTGTVPAKPIWIDRENHFDQ